MPKGTLSDFQLALAQAFAREGTGFFLTGGAVLAGWELAHRTTDDLDFFTTDDEAMSHGDSALRRAAHSLGATVEPLTTSPDFRRYLVRSGGASVKVDLVRDRVPQIADKAARDGIAMDSAEEIYVNKLCALVERSEVRDLVDLMLLERKGFSLERALPLAERKDGGATAATLAWLLSTLPLPEHPPGGVSRDELLAYRKSLESRLIALARPAAT